MPREEPQPPNAKTQVMCPEKRCLTRFFLSILLRQIVEAAHPDFGPKRGAKVAEKFARYFWQASPGSCDNVVNDACNLQVAVSAVAKSGSHYRFFLGGLLPFLHPAGSRLAQKPCLAKHRFDRVFNLVTQAVDDASHPLNPLRTASNLFKTVADRLFARNVRRCAQYGCEKPRRFTRHISAAVCIAPAKAETWSAWLGVYVDKAPVDFAPSRAVTQGSDRLVKRRIGQD